MVKEVRNRKERAQTGVEIEDDTWNQVVALLKEYGVTEEDLLKPVKKGKESY
jgi:LDH2 family malate/lactate/ureidoglycolate dehydrogenase